LALDGNTSNFSFSKASAIRSRSTTMVFKLAKL
jgi:hypothetical protein